MARAARYSPAGQPSVRWTSSSVLESGSSTPAPLSNSAASLRAMASSVVPISTIRPCTRSRAAGMGIGSRDAMASRHPFGTRNANSAIEVRHSRLVTASAWSSTKTNGPLIVPKVDTNDGMTSTPPPDVASSWDAAGLTGAIWPNAVMTAVQNATGSLSVFSHETHATRGPRRSAHCASNVVLPYPGGATTVIRGSSEANSRSSSVVRATTPARVAGAWNLGSSAPTAGAVEDFCPLSDTAEPTFEACPCTLPKLLGAWWVLQRTSIDCKVTCRGCHAAGIRPSCSRCPAGSARAHSQKTRPWLLP